MNYHFIAIGGAIMHNLAIALSQQGHTVTGSDDKIFDPAKSNLEHAGIMPAKIGFDAGNVHAGLDAVILGMHAKKGNPELDKAQELDIKIFSFPEFIYENARDKTRIVIAGSHGKTTITSMVMHALGKAGIDFDYLVGAKIKGFDLSVKLTKKARYIVLEGDEYLSSAIHPEPKFTYYKPHVALLSGIAWDHVNVFPTYENYLSQFEKLLMVLEPDAKLVYNSEDEEVQKLVDDNIMVKEARQEFLAYKTSDYRSTGEGTIVNHDQQNFALQVFGRHNMQNLEGARLVCAQIGVNGDDFYKYMNTYKGAARRLQQINANDSTVVFNDFAHSPSKLKATINAVKEQFPQRKLVACMELHTYSSLNKAFLAHYKDTMEKADEAIVYFNPETIALKGLEMISVDDVEQAFNKKGLKVFNDSTQMFGALMGKQWPEKNLLWMTSGNFDGLDIKAIAAEIVRK